ncbi:uncharacterized protein MYCFIDRAFT_75208 [Pseudocercospora fijiensis CIRAD86]|uniref:Uncharacterized protein n=1 Tax=Pseudocercospora fijiensis (strain CIRAD86) TaxID=383855 RepID=N1Q8V9_PSEFD|nr:uncharacterized protein MYCFIDRAFT_75208 [Pseudocercospora fijiensis CIRAD86]EME87347.1 hypothetical protein MYCFIDRAFT_75208 [Pseudocercospora fijiensis CIRAD86]
MAADATVNAVKMGLVHSEALNFKNSSANKTPIGSGKKRETLSGTAIMFHEALLHTHDESQKGDAYDEQPKRDSMFTGEDKPKEGHPVRKNKVIPRGSRPIAVIIPERRSSSTQQESSPDSIIKIAAEKDGEDEEEEEEEEERGRSRSRYTPGDATKRGQQTTIEIFQPPPPRHNTTTTTTTFPIPETEPPHRPISFYAIQDLRAARSILDNELLHHPHRSDDSITTTSNNPDITTHFQNPKFQFSSSSPHDRPNWSQKSEAGSSVRRTLFSSSSDRRPVKKDSRSNLEKDAAATRQRSKFSGGGGGGGGGEHLIADAVKIIQRQERLKKRQSVMGFFKRL